MLRLGIFVANVCTAYALLPRLAIRGGAFVVAATGAPWQPAGLNYVRLNGTQGAPQPHLPVYHATFSPRYYNHSAVADAVASACQRFGYNFIRVFIDGGSWDRADGINGNPAGPQPLSSAYVANVAAFVVEASGAGCYTMLTLNSLPQNAYFSNATGAAPAWCEYPQCDLFAPQFVGAWQVYASLFASALRTALPGGVTTGLLSWSLANEGFFLDTSLPFSNESLIVTTADGLSYSMGDAASRQQCADANTVHWVDAVASALRTADPGTLITTGMFTNAAVGKGGFNGLFPDGADPRHPFRPASLSQWSSLDYIDVHVYPFGPVVPMAAGETMGHKPAARHGSPAPPWSLDADLATEEWPLLNFSRVPVLMCETGGFKAVYDNVSAAAVALVELRRLAASRHFLGVAVWTWDTWEQSGFLWSMVDAAYAIAQALSPLSQ